MAEAAGKLTGRPGIALVTRGPGACNAAIGVHTAMQDSTPMILLVGQVARDQAEREAFQEIDYRRMFAPVAKWAAQIDDAARIPELLGRAFTAAVSGRPGPVVLALPEDMLSDVVMAADVEPFSAPLAWPGEADLAVLDNMLAQAKRPLMIVGGSGWTPEASRQLQTFAETRVLPVACSFRRQDVFDNRSSSYAGDLGTGPNPRLLERIRTADLLLVIGARLGEMTTQGYALIESPQPRQTLIHVHSAAEEPGRLFRPSLAIQANPVAMAAALAGRKPSGSYPWAAQTAAARAEYLSWQTPPASRGALNLGEISLWLREHLPIDAIVTMDAGNFSGWGQRYFRFSRPGRLLGPTSGAMGYAVPAGVAASLLYPDKTVVTLVGDGGFMMTGQELATALQFGAKPIILLYNNGMYGTIRMHQERHYPGRTSATDLINPNFAALAASYGAYSAAISRTADFAPAFAAALTSGKAAVLELQMDPEQITTGTTLSAIRQAAMQKVPA